MTLSDTTPTSSDDYQRWINYPSETGAPLNKDGTPKLAGDLNADWVMNDLDTTDRREKNPGAASRTERFIVCFWV